MAVYEWVLAYAPSITTIGAIACVVLCVLFCITKKFGFYAVQFVVALANILLCHAYLFLALQR